MFLLTLRSEHFTAYAKHLTARVFGNFCIVAYKRRVAGEPFFPVINIAPVSLGEADVCSPSAVSAVEDRFKAYLLTERSELVYSKSQFLVGRVLSVVEA